MKIVILYSEGDLAEAFPHDFEGRDSNDQELYKALNALGHEVSLLPADDGMLPALTSKKAERHDVHHDTVIMHTTTTTIIQIDGHKFELGSRKLDPDIQIVVRNDTTHVIVDDEEVGKF